jgi:hypothetical protein
MPPGRRAQQRHQRALAQVGHVGHRPHAPAVQLGRGLLAHAPEQLDRQRVQELALAVGLDDEQAVRLADPARDLGQELGPGHADRDRQADPFPDLLAQPRRDLGGRTGDHAQATHIQERLVDGDALDQRRRVMEDLEHGLAGRGVGRHPRLDDDRVGAQQERLPAAHRRAHAAALGLVARRQHDPHAHDHRAATQARVVPLLYRRVERVQIGVQDRGVPGHRTHVLTPGWPVQAALRSHAESSCRSRSVGWLAWRPAKRS